MMLISENYLHMNIPKARMEAINFIEEDNCLELYRNLHDENGFT